MCGIAGVAGHNVSGVDRMLAHMSHRGPDRSAVVQGGRATLGCARLSIRGGALGEQPRKTHRGLLVFNGEVYNSAELVKDLAWHGVTVDGASDTRIVGALLDIYGIRAVDRLNGMFALAWDDGETVWLARDPAGVKPLYYRGDRFASEIRPLLDAPVRLCGAALARWLTFHYPFGEQTMFQDVLRVPAGGIVALPEGRLVRGSDHALRFSAANPALNAERLRKVVSRAIRDATPAGPFGVCLSGGTDSTLVAALAEGARFAYHGRVAAPGCDESAYARAAAEALGLELIEIPIDARACLEALPQVIRSLEEPVAGPGSVAQWLVARRAANDVRVLMSGCGGDELFGGYARAVALVRDTPPAGLENYAPLFARAAGLPPAERAFALLNRRSDGLFAPDFLAAHPAPREDFLASFSRGGLEPLAAAARAEIGTTLPALLQVEDRVTMAHGIEGRVPLLDRRLLRVAARLAPEARVDEAGRAKAMLRAAAAPHLPSVVSGRTDKMGFPLPIADWFAGPWRAFAREVLLDRRTLERGMIDSAGVERAFAPGGRYDRGLWSALALELWCRTFLDE